MSLTGFRLSLSRAVLFAAAAAFCGLLWLPVRPALAATTYTVDSQADSPKLGASGASCKSTAPGNPCTLRAAVDTINLLGVAGAIVQVPGTFVIPVLNANGPLHAQLSMTIISTGGGRATIDGQHQVGILTVDSTVTVTLTDLVIQNGLRSGASGGAVLLSGTLVTHNVAFDGNQATFSGGAIYVVGGLLNMDGGSVSGGSAMSGGAVLVTGGGSMSATGTLFANNTAVTGGAIDNQGRATLNGVNVVGNQAQSAGGGVLAIGNSAVGPAQLDVLSSTIKGNSAGKAGGGIAVGFSNLTLGGSTLDGNQGTTLGGGLAVIGGNATLGNDTITGNSASEGGGIFQATALPRQPTAREEAAVRAVRAAAGQQGAGTGDPTGFAHKSTAPVSAKPDAVSLESITISGNSATTGGGIWNESGPFSIHDTIVATNSASGSSPDCAGPVNSIGYNLESAIECGFTATGDKEMTAPRLGPLTDNGGPTQTLALMPGSPAIDAGDPACPPPLVDQRGVTRPQGPRCDIGAFEATVPALPVPAPPATGRHA